MDVSDIKEKEHLCVMLVYSWTVNVLLKLNKFICCVKYMPDVPGVDYLLFTVYYYVLSLNIVYAQVTLI